MEPRIGLSTYSLESELKNGRMSLKDVIEFAAEIGADCLEAVPFSYRFTDELQPDGLDHRLIRDCRKWTADAGVPLCNYSVLADFCKEGDALKAEIARVCREVDVAAELGLDQMRHDVCSFRRPHLENTAEFFEKWLPVMAESAEQVSLYAKKRGVLTLIENHGFFANGVDRVSRIIDRVQGGNYGLLLDIGNVTCVDEDPTVAASQLAPRCRMVHLKDFYIRRRDPGDSHLFDCEGTWFRSRGGKYLRGAIFAQGDLDIPAILSTLKQNGYHGSMVIEFEGMEDARYASAVGLANARRIWQEAPDRE